MDEMPNSLDTTEYRKLLWDKEYSERKKLPSTFATSDRPSRAFRNAIEQLEDLDKSALLDLGAGNFRNSIWAVKEAGFKHATGIEFSDVAVALAKKSISDAELEDKVTVLHQSVGNKIDLPDESFPVAIDMMVMHSLTKEDRESFANELQRLLKPGGYFIFYTIAGLEEFDDETTAFGNLVKESPGPEDGSYRFQVENDWVTEKGFTEQEILDLFPELALVTLEPRVEFTPAFGDVYKRVYYYGVMQKPKV